MDLFVRRDSKSGMCLLSSNLKGGFGLSLEPEKDEFFPSVEDACQFIEEHAPDAEIDLDKLRETLSEDGVFHVSVSRDVLERLKVSDILEGPAA